MASRKQLKKKAGRPTVMTSRVVDKLEEAFSMDCTVVEACIHAGISRDAFYDYKGRNPEFSDRVESLRAKPVLKARSTVFRDLHKPETAKWYLERKAKNEFTKQRLANPSNGNDPDPLHENIRIIAESLTREQMDAIEAELELDGLD